MKLVFPSVLSVLGGLHRVATLGRNLFDLSTEGRAISGARDEGLYMKGDHVLHWRLNPEEIRLLRVDDGRMGSEDVSGELPEVYDRLFREHFSQYETVRRLMNEGRIFPRD